MRNLLDIIIIAIGVFIIILVFNVIIRKIAYQIKSKKKAIKRLENDPVMTSKPEFAETSEEDGHEMNATSNEKRD
ncbi:hypothetical protein N7U66_11825 [Lacinutrix neustonica]|uniref:Uncharacterized protein n=1 Tax=Lacinutrix neustonica TaxID=2980107 RepID=A0A9E8MV68_9FLAO|nr:hypothetical protein [Lacinutrix neustonica]WAC00915.1 hypothetical protein N7U66_11825 [Lacinutrix neustonica]